MKRLCILMLTMSLLLVGCGQEDQMDQALELRKKLLNGSGCSFEAVVTADYGEEIYTFTMECSQDVEGKFTFTVKDPDTISGISGTISDQNGHLVFDDQILLFETVCEGQITPVTAPWLVLHTLRSGYLAACGKDGENMKMSIDDSYKEDALHLDIWADPMSIPIRGEILWNERRVLTVDIRNFQFQ